MALADLTFKLYNDSALTSEFNGTLQLTHETDLSDNPQDFVLYFGSTNDERQLQANSNPGVDNIEITPTNQLAEWVASTAYSLGDRIEPTTPNTFVYECTTAGTSDSGEPTFPTGAIGDTVADNTVIWTLVAARHEITEIKVATTSGGLPGATPGAAMSLGTSVTGGTSNDEEVHIRITNAVATVISNTGFPEIGLDINEVIETEI